MEDNLVENGGSPRSSFKLIDETLECKLFYSVNKHVTLEKGCSNFSMMGHSLSNNDNEDEIEELAAKCYDLDNEIEVLKKKF